MRIKRALILLPVLVSVLGCNSQANTTLKLDKFTFSNNEINVSFISNVSSFNVYSKNKTSEYVFKKKITSKNYTYSNPNEFLKIIPIVNGSEDTSHALEINYFSSIFNNESVYTFDPSMPNSYIQEVIDQNYNELQSYEFSSKRVAYLFTEGEYRDVIMKNGYYTSGYGLGEAPTDVSIKKLEVKNHPGTGNALINFWRSNENFHVRDDSIWATSQAAPLRRMSFAKGLVLSDFEEGKQNWSSGGFIANSFVKGGINSGTQQQFYLRNTKFSAYSHANFNMVYEGCNGIIPSGDFKDVHSTILETNLATYDKPNLIYKNNKGLGVNLYKKIENAYSYSWGNIIEEDSQFIPIDQFFVISQNSNAKKINEALASGKHLLFTPGIYDIDQTLEINNPNTIVLGLGMATLRCKNTDAIMNINAKGVSVNGLILQSGEYSTSLMNINASSDEGDETRLADIFFRNGGEDNFDTYSDACLVINQDNVISDHIWIWRADHGSNIGWNKNVGKKGLIANGNNLIFHCLMVEHYEEYQSVFNGDNITTIFYQSETPYDALNQSDWARGEEEEDYGYASYFVSPNVSTHTAYGLGVYYHSIAPIPVYAFNAFEVTKKEGINLTNMVTRHFGGKGGLIHFINEMDGIQDGEGVGYYFLENF